MSGVCQTIVSLDFSPHGRAERTLANRITLEAIPRTRSTLTPSFSSINSFSKSPAAIKLLTLSTSFAVFLNLAFLDAVIVIDTAFGVGGR